MLKKVLPLFLSLLFLLGTDAVAQPSGGSSVQNSEVAELQDVQGQAGDTQILGNVKAPLTINKCLEFDAQGNIVASIESCGGGATSITDLSDVSAVTGNSTVVATAAGVFTPGDCLEIDVNGNIVGTGAACSAAPATTEAGLEAQLGDVVDVFTNNDGALTDDDVSDDRPTDMLAIPNATYFKWRNAANSADLDVIQVDALDNVVMQCGQNDQFEWYIGAGESPTRLVRLGVNSHMIQKLAGDLRIDANTGAMHTTGTTVTAGATGATKFAVTDANGTTPYWEMTVNSILTLGDRFFLNKSLDGADNGAHRIYSGGGTGVNRGARALILANEFSALPGLAGKVELAAGNVPTGTVDMRTGNDVLQWRVDITGDLDNQADNNLSVQDDVYAAGWDGNTDVPTKNAVYDKIETLGGGGGGGGASGVTYYDHTFTWPGGTTTGAALQTETITHNVGRHPDRVEVYYEDATDGWFRHHDFWRNTNSEQNGWIERDHAGSDANVVVIDFYQNLSVAAGNALVRLFWDTDDDISTATTGLKAINGGAGANSLITYYNHNFTWLAGTGVAAQSTQTITHNVGRPPDKIAVYYKGANGWWEHFDLTAFGGNNYGWDAKYSGVNNDNETSIRIYGNNDNALGDGMIRLFWYSDDPIDTAVDGRVDISTSQGTSYVTGTEVLTGDTFNGKAVYAKTIDMGAGPNATSKVVAHGVVGGMDFVMPDSSMIAIDAATGTSFQVNLAGGANDYDLWTVDKDDASNITWTASSNRTAYTGTLILKYTKP